MFKKVSLVLFAFTLIISSCSKEEEAKIFDVKKAYGKWEVVGGDNFKKCPDGDNQIIEITESEFKEGQITDEGCANSGVAKLSYEYKDGNTFDIGLGTYKIMELTSTKMTLEIATPLAPGSSTTMLLEKYSK